MRIICVFMVFCFLGIGHAQSAKARLEAQRKQLQQEIVQINGLIKQTKNTTSNALETVENLELKIERLDQLIRLTNRQVNSSGYYDKGLTRSQKHYCCRCNQDILKVIQREIPCSSYAEIG